MAFETILQVGVGKNAKPKSFNLGNKSATLAANIIKNAGDDTTKTKVDMKLYDLLEVEPTEQEVERAEKGGYDALPRLYLICEYEGKKGIRVRCNDEDFLNVLREAKKNEMDIVAEATQWTPDGATRPRSFFTLDSWS